METSAAERFSSNRRVEGLVLISWSISWSASLTSISPFASFAFLALSCQCIWQHILFQWWYGELSLPSRTCRYPSRDIDAISMRASWIVWHIVTPNGRWQDYGLAGNVVHCMLDVAFESTHQLLAKLIISDCLLLHVSFSIFIKQYSSSRKKNYS